MKLIDKDAIVAEIEKKKIPFKRDIEDGYYPTYLCALMDFEDFINTLEVINPCEEHIQYDSIKSGIQRHAETYSFNIESELFNQLTKEQQVLWRKEIEQACINGGEAGVELARDLRYKENLEMKEVGNTELLKVKGYLVRDKDDYTAIYAEKPHRGKTEWVDGNHPRNANESSCLFTMDARLLPNVEFDDEPVEVEVTITKKRE